MTQRTTNEPLSEPLRFERIALEKVWGGRRLETVLGIELPGSGPIGETWELADRSDHNSVVAEGRYRGKSLAELMRDHGDAILGRARAARDGRFPLLIKFLDAREHLSVQVHPRTGPQAQGEEQKTESWLFLAAEPDGKIWLGLDPRVGRGALAGLAGKREIVASLHEWPARPGEFAFVPGGTVHAIGAGVTLLEVQENSDTTHRLYDWDRMGLDGKPRAMHVDEALRCVDYGNDHQGPIKPSFAETAAGARRAKLCDASAFALELLEIERSIEADTDELAHVYIVLAGRGSLRYGEHGSRVSLKPGDTWLVPASLGVHQLESAGGTLRVVRADTKGAIDS
jgi:mannose-6-phosphate isomerase